MASRGGGGADSTYMSWSKMKTIEYTEIVRQRYLPRLSFSTFWIQGRVSLARNNGQSRSDFNRTLVFKLRIIVDVFREFHFVVTCFLNRGGFNLCDIFSLTEDKK